jgi:hypothetical protein
VDVSGRLHHLAVVPALWRLEDEFITLLKLWKRIIAERV